MCLNLSLHLINACYLSISMVNGVPTDAGTFWCVLPDPIRNVQRLVVKLSGLSLELPPSARTVLQPSTVVHALPGIETLDCWNAQTR